MAEISKITLPSGNTYNLKDATAREMISGGVSFIVAWDGAAAPTVANIPKGVVVTYSGQSYTGTMEPAAAQAGAFYLVKSSTQKGVLDTYDEYVPVGNGTSKSWEKIGDTQLDLSDLGDLAYKDSVALTKSTVSAVTSVSVSTQPTVTVTPTKDNVLGADTTFKVTQPTITQGAKTTDSVLGADTTFTVTQPTVTQGTKTTDNVLGADTSFTVTQPTITVTPTTTKVAGITSTGTASTWTFSMGTGDYAETLIISGANSTAPTKSDTTVLTGVAASASGCKVTASGDTVAAVTSIGNPTASGCKVSASGDNVSAITAIGNPTASGTAVAANTDDTVSAMTGATATASGTAITTSTSKVLGENTGVTVS